VKAFAISNALLATTPTQSGNSFSRGAVLSISSNGTSAGIVWAGHFITPTVADGRVYFGTSTTVAVFGLLP
jgi:hypothetical protein